MDILDVGVTMEERADLDEDMYWRPGMSCPVKGCDSTFTKYTDLRLHWNRIHQPLVTYFCCTQCAFRTVRRNQLQRHLRRRHHCAVEESKLLSDTGTESVNSKFLNPGETELPLMRPTATMIQRREEESVRRAAEAGAMDVSTLVSRTVSVARDQEVVPLGRGQAIIRNQVRWLRGMDSCPEQYSPLEVDFDQFPIEEN